MFEKDMDAQMTETIREYFKTKPVEKAWIFGSFSRGEERPDSDVDIIVRLTPGARMGFAFFGMICDLEEKLSRAVDLVVDGNLLPFAQKTANIDKILIFEKEVCK